MWKWLSGIAIVVIAVVSVAYEQHYASEKNEARRQKDCVSFSVSPEEKHACGKDAQSRKDYSPWWEVLVAWPGGIQNWAIIATGFVIAWQSNETRRAAKAAESTVSVMKNSNTQWVELEPDGLFTRAEVGQPDPPTIVTIHPRWKVINNTSLPLTIKTLEVKIATSEGWESYVFEFDELISPAKRDNFRSFFVPFKLNTQETAQFLADVFELSIAIKVWFVGASGQDEEQTFGDMYICRVGQLEINYPIGKGPQKQYTEKDNSPSTMVEVNGYRTLEPSDSLPSKPN